MAFNLRPAERRPTWTAFGFLTLLIASHAVLETARDALFLAGLPATQLPFVYLAIALLSIVIARVEMRSLRAWSQRTALLAWTSLASLGTLLLWWLLPGHSAGGTDAATRFGLYALYVWSGIIAALALTHFWSLLGEALSVTQAKRLYPLIGAGSVVGALLGSALASALAQRIGTDTLLLWAAGGFALSTLAGSALSSIELSAANGPALGSNLARPAPAADPTLDVQPMSGGDLRVMEDARLVARLPYVRRVAWLCLVSAACLTFVDYMFKSAVASTVAPARLATFFGGVALVLNLLSLLCQVSLSPWLLKRFELGVALAVLPGLLAVGGVGLMLGVGLVAALFLKGADGALRYSLHRTASELLYVPLPDHARPRIKAVVDAVGQRGGQALASLAILALVALHPPFWLLAAAMLALAGLWLAVALDLRRHYVALLRKSLLVGGTLRPSPFPEFDVASLETLVSALDSRNDTEVLAALDVFEREGKAHLVPALILHHPSELVVERALALFAHARRTDVVHVIDRLFEHASVRLRSAAIAVRSLLVPDARRLYTALSLESAPEVRATIVVHLIASGEIVGAEAHERLQDILIRGRTETKVALAEAIGWRREHTFDAVLIALSETDELEVRLAAISAMAEHTVDAYLPALVRALGDERTRNPARHALVGYGDAGFAAVVEALRDRSVNPAVRWQLPRALGLFEAQRSADTLLDLLAQESDGMIRYRIIRALETLVARDPSIALERRALHRVITETISRAYRHFDERTTLELGAGMYPERRTPGHELLVRVLHDKEDNACDRLFRLLGLAHPSADFARIRRNLRSSDAKTRASCIELVSNLVELPLRRAVLGLVDELPDAERLSSAPPFYVRAGRGYEALLEHMLTSESEAVQDLTAFHVGELELVGFRPLIAALAEASPARADVARTLTRLDQRAKRLEVEHAQ